MRKKYVYLLFQNRNMAQYNPEIIMKTILSIRNALIFIARKLRYVYVSGGESASIFDFRPIHGNHAMDEC